MALLKETNQFVNFVDLLTIKFGPSITSSTERETIEKFWEWVNQDPSAPRGASDNIEKYFNSIGSNEYPSWLADTSLGGNEAINSWYQYGPDDDISYDGLMGRVYRKSIENNKQLLHLSFGLPHLGNPLSFYNSAILGKVRGQAAARLSPNDPEFQRISFFRETTHRLVNIGKVIVNGLFNALGPSTAETTTPINKYYEIRPEMASYHKHVNTILHKLAIAMNILEELEDREQPGDSYTDAERFPAPFAETGLDIALIRSRRERLANNLDGTYADRGFNFHETGDGNLQSPTDYELEKHEERKVVLDDIYYKGGGTLRGYEQTSSSGIGDKILTVTNARNWFGDFSTAATDSLSRNYEFISFKVDADINTSESFSNSTTSSSISELLSGVADTVRDLYYSSGFNQNVSGLAQEFGADVFIEKALPDVAGCSC